jgi:hypothetical protein
MAIINNNAIGFKLDFIGIGAAKCGTTWLADMLRQHPDIFIPTEKELHYFNKTFVDNVKIDNFQHHKPLEWYMEFFKKAKPGQIKGEFTAFYMPDEYAAKNIFEFNPDIKIIAILRDPVERAFSNYNYFKQLGKIDDVTFEQAIEKAPAILERSNYHKHLKRYFDIFPHENIKVMFFDDIKKDPENFLKEAEVFLGVKEFIPSNIRERSNVTVACRFQKFGFLMQRARLRIRKTNSMALMNAIRFLKLNKFHTWIIRHNKKAVLNKPRINDETRKRLNEYYSDEIAKLEKLVNRDLSHWK